MRMRILGILLFFWFSAFNQSEQKSYSLNGYIKNMQTGIFNHLEIPQAGIDTVVFLQDNLIHNRLNFAYYANSNWTIKAELRSRIFWGDIVNNTPEYGDQIDDASNDYLKLSTLIVNKNRFVIHSYFDRLYADYTKGNLQMRVGRQRINWGINTVWNPNDVFNAFSYTDFDYEERPGSDAILVRYYTGFASSVEIAAKVFDKWEDAVIAGLWKWNKWNYDFQLLTGFVSEELVLGGGWAGNIRNSGFKGEFSYFHPFEEGVKESFAASLAWDYTFKKGIYSGFGFLYNSNGSLNTPISDLFSFELSAKNLYPFKYAIFGSASYGFTPLVNGSLAIIYSPGKANALLYFWSYTPRPVQVRHILCCHPV